MKLDDDQSRGNSTPAPTGLTVIKQFCLKIKDARAFKATWKYRVYSAAVLASILFSYIESTVKEANTYATQDVYIILRAILGFVIFSGFVALTKLQKKWTPVAFSSLLHIKLETGFRGILGALCITFMSISLAKNSSQTFSYSFFMLHPLFTLFLTSTFTNKTVDYKRQWKPIALTVIGAIGYSVVGQIMKGGLAGLKVSGWLPLFYAYGAPALAGLLFAAENLLSSIIEDNYGIDPVTISFQTTFVTAITMPFFAAILYVIVGEKLRVDVIHAAFIWKIVLVSVLAVLANLLITAAFTEATDEQMPKVAILDLAVLPFAALLGLASEEVTFMGDKNPLVSPAGAMLLLILLGAAWSVFTKHKKADKTKANSKPVQSHTRAFSRWRKLSRLACLMILLCVLV